MFSTINQITKGFWNETTCNIVTDFLFFKSGFYLVVTRVILLGVTKDSHFTILESTEAP